MRRRIIFMFLAGIVWAVFIVLNCAWVFGNLNTPSEFSFFNDYAIAGNRVYITENKIDSGILYAIDENCVVSNLYDSKAYANGGTFQVLSYSPDCEYGCVYALVKREVTSGGISSWAWQVFTFDAELKHMYVSGLFIPREGDYVSDVEAEKDHFAIVSVKKDGSAAYSFKLPYEEMLSPAEALAAEKLGEYDVKQAAASGQGGINGIGASLDATEASSDSNRTAIQNVVEGEDGLGVLNGTVVRVLSINKSSIAPAGHFIADANYSGGNIEVRLDGDPSFSYSEHYEKLREIFENKKLSLRQKASVNRDTIRIALVLIGVGFVVIFLFVFVVGSRSRNVYTIISIEFLIAIITAVGIQAFLHERESIKIDSARRFTGYSILSLYDELGNIENLDYYSEDFYDSQEYRDVQKRISASVFRRGAEKVFYDILIVDTATGDVVVSASGRNKEKLSLQYTTSTDKILSDLKSGEELSYVDFGIEGITYTAIGVRGPNVFTPKYALVGIASETYIGDNILIARYRNVLLGVIIFVICSIVVISFMYVQSLDLRRITKGMQEIATGKLYSEKPKFLMGRDLDTLWNAMYEVDKRVQSINYTKFLIFESYYRFAPKAIERLLNKSSITEVKGGDTTDLNGTVALIAGREWNNYDVIDTNAFDIQLDVIAKYQDEEKGILVSSDASLTLMEMYFPKESRETCAFGVNLMHQLGTRLDMDSINSVILLHYDRYKYSVVGNMSQASAFLISQQTVELSDYLLWLRSLNIRLIVTQSVKEREAISGKIRYIGFITLKCDGKDMHLYEILDAETEEIRQLKMDSLYKFREALNLFYANDFYLAMNAFTEIIKKNEADGVAKWYLFKCEELLNSGRGEYNGSLIPFT